MRIKFLWMLIELHFSVSQMHQTTLHKELYIHIQRLLLAMRCNLQSCTKFTRTYTHIATAAISLIDHSTPRFAESSFDMTSEELTIYGYSNRNKKRKKKKKLRA